MTHSPWFTAALAALLLAACAPSDNDHATAESEPETRPAAEPPDDVDLERQGSPRLGDWGIETRHFNTDIKPGNDFFTYVNSGWLEGTEIPDGFARFGSFTELAIEAEDQVEAIIAEAAEANAETGDARQQIGDAYASYLDTDTIEARGLDPIRAELDSLLAIDDHAAAARWMARLGTGSIVGIGVSQDAGNPDRYLVHLGQSGLGLPGKDYYERDDEPFPGHREAYIDYITETFERAGIDRPRERAEAVMALETELAGVHWTRVERRDRQANYNLMTREELEEYAPGFDWPAFLAERGVDDQSELVVATDTAVRDSAAIFADTDAATWGSWHAFHWINNHARQLPAAYEDAHFDFFQRRLEGVSEPRARDRRAIEVVSSQLGELIGQVYVERHFPPDYRAQMETLVEYLRRAFAERLESLDWMDDETRAEAEAKLAAFDPKIGYPDRWRDYSSVEIRADDLIGNSQRLRQWQWQDSLARLGEPVRDWEWFMTPQTVNAYYSSTRNEIVFPAAILQPPFFDPWADPAVNFGAIGGVIGHEMGHGFDDQGSRSDADGVLRNWWTDTARERFEERTATLVAQYDAFEPLEGENIQGDLALGENIGDLGGLSIAHHAYHLYLQDNHGGSAPELDGTTGDQRFFMAWAQVWRNLWADDEALRGQLIRGPHSPPKYRVNGVVRNIDAWYEAFDIDSDSELYLPPEQRVSIW